MVDIKQWAGKHKWFFALICSIISIILLCLSVFSPWYHQTATIEFLGTTEASSNYYLFQVEVEGGMMGFSYSDRVSYVEDDFPQETVADTFFSTMGIVGLAFLSIILLIIFSIIADKNKPLRMKFALIVALFAFIITLAAPLYLMASLPSAFDADHVGLDDEKPGYTESFFGSEKDDFTDSELKWGPSSGWFMALTASILNLIAFLILLKIYREPKAYPMPVQPPHPVQPAPVQYQYQQPYPPQQPPPYYPP